MRIGEYYTEIKTNLIWKLVNVEYQGVELENYDTTYCVTVDEFKEEFKLLGT